MLCIGIFANIQEVSTSWVIPQTVTRIVRDKLEGIKKYLQSVDKARADKFMDEATYE